MKEIIDQIEILKKEFESLKPIAEKDNDLLWQKFRLEWNFNSNHIEGNTLTYGDTKLLFRLGDDFKAQNNSLKDVNEMRAHDVAIHLIQEWSSEEGRRLTEKDIRELNQIILVKDFWAAAQTPDGQPTRRKIKVGQYKEQPNHVVLKSGKVFPYAEPQYVPFKMKELLEWYDTQQDENPLVVAAFLHYKFVMIHPFDDGNGRVSRLLMNYHLMRNGYLPLIITSKDKPNYLAALRQADANNIPAFIEYLGKQLVWSFDIGIKAAKGESIVEQDDLYKEIEVWKKQLKSGMSSNPKRVDAQSMELYDNCIAAIFDLITQKALTFNDLFVSNKITRSYKIHGSNSFFEFPPNRIVDYRKKETSRLEKFKLVLKFKTPMSISDSKDIAAIEVIANLDIFEYSFSIDDELYNKNYSYNHFLTEDEIENIAQKVIASLFEKIKNIST